MDHQVFAELLGNYGEFIGAIAVVVTLGYLAVQVKSSTRQARATMVHNISESFNQHHQTIMENPQLAEIFVKKLKEENLTDAEAIQWDSFTNRVINIYMSIQRAYDESQIDRHYYETICEDVRRASLKYGLGDSMRELLDEFPNEARSGIFVGLYSP